MSGIDFQEVQEEKDLGMVMDSELKFLKLVSAAALKTNQLLGIIKRTFTNLPKDILPVMYSTLVRPHLDYGNILWNMRYTMNGDKMEKVQ